MTIVRTLALSLFAFTLAGCVCCPQRCDTPGSPTPVGAESAPPAKTGTIPYSDAGAP